MISMSKYFLLVFNIGTVFYLLERSPTPVQAYQQPNMDNSSSPTLANYDELWEKNAILPKDVIPSHYNLFLNPDLQNGTFSGEVDISINVSKQRHYLLLHIHELEIIKTSVYNEAGSEIKIYNSFSYPENQYWVILLKESIVPGKYSIKIQFSGSLTGKIVGFYRSTYTAQDGSKRYIATTKFEPTYARKAFPCFDEPRYKASFTVHITRPSDNKYFALSNMNQVSEEPDVPSVGLTKVSFAPSPPMSTYLACFIVCDFEHLEPVNTDQGIPITLYARASQLNNTKFSRDIAQQVMNHFVKYFDIEYPLPKIDLIAIPDFVSGAMENWGLITFRETSVLVAPDDSISNQQVCADTVTHELAHMWFGDLVTMAWWDDLWLNEGFATFLSQKFVGIVKENLFSPIKFVVNHVQSVLEDDAALSSHPIIQPVNHPDQITEIFDIISYSKGSSVLRMFESYSPIAFQTAVSKYLKKFTYKNAVTEDLWEAMEKEYNISNMRSMLNTWTKQMGYPLVNVKRDGDSLTLTQSRFLSNAEATYDPKQSPYGYKWDIPITYITSTSPLDKKKIVFPKEKESLTVDLGSGVEWYKINSEQFGFYRVNYTDEWLKFLPLLGSQALSNPIDRANLLDDSFSLAKAGYLTYEVPFQLVSFLKNGSESHYVPWAVASKHFYRYKNILHNTPAYTDLMKFGTSLIPASLLKDIWEVKSTASNLEKQFKITLLSFACRLEIPDVMDRANEIFTAWLNGETGKPNHLIRSLIYKYGVRGANEEANRQKLWDLYLKELDPIDKSDYMAAIASVSNPKIISRLLELIKNEDNVRSQDYFIFLDYICLTSPAGGEFIWEYIRSNWDYFVKRFTLNDRTLGRVLPKCTAYFATEEKLKEVEDFITKYPDAGAGAAGRKKAVESIKNNIKWRKQHYENVSDILKKLAN
ncbi:glutamyl aminopeptidase [Halyomorpha halys]|uniref:glutamyl aminopeptidase n=1 Tax=Halyomorpha halys TaxID=286706 RepID=UPI0034D1FC78